MFPTCGSLSGDSNAPQDFIQVYDQGISTEHTRQDTVSSDRSLTKAKDILGGSTVRGAIGGGSGRRRGGTG